MIRFGTVIKNIGKLILLVDLTLVLPLILSLFSGKTDTLAFAYTIIITTVVGLACTFFAKSEGNIRAKESYLIVTAGWFIITFLGSLPYVFAGAFPDYSSAFFETMSGFTTTGSTALTDVEALSKELLLWRSMTQWLGGLGVVVLFVAVLSQVSTGGQSMLRAELSGPYEEKISAHIKDSAMILWKIYLVLTLILVVLLCFGGMSLFDSVCHSLTTMATGGFSTKNASIAAFDSAYIEWVITIFMFLAGISYPLYYKAMTSRSLKPIVKNQEVRLYFCVAVIASLFIFVNLMLYWDEGTASEKLRHSFFNLITMLTTTGFASDNFDVWPAASHVLLMCIMMIGACYSSTSGSIKMGTYLLGFKTLTAQMFRMQHPRALVEIKVNNKVVPDRTALKVNQFFVLTIVIMFLGAIGLSMTGLTFAEAFTGSMTAITNSGPAMGRLGASGNFSEVTAAGKWIMSILMLGGRLELYTVLIVFMPSFWRR